MKFFKKVDSIFLKIDQFFAYIGAAALIFMALLTFVDVVFRYIINISLRGAQEMVEMAMPIMVYGAMTLAVRYKKQISVEFVMERIPKPARMVIDTALTVICSASMFIMCVKLCERVAYYLGGIYTTYVARIPYAPFYIFVAICAFIMGVEFLLNAIKEIFEIVDMHKNKKAKGGEAE